MNLGDGSVSLPEKSTDGGSDDVGSTENDRVLSRDGNSSGVDEVDDSSGSARSEERSGETRREMSDVGGVESGKQGRGEGR